MFMIADYNSTGQPAHPRSLISTFDIRSLKSAISKLVECKISLRWLVSVAEQAGLSRSLQQK